MRQRHPLPEHVPLAGPGTRTAEPAYARRSTAIVIAIGLLISSVWFSIAGAGAADRSDRDAVVDPSAADSAVDRVLTQTTENPSGCMFCREFGELLWIDTRYVLTAPLHWSEHDWKIAAVAGLTVVGTAAALDNPVQKAIRRNRTGATDRLGNVFAPFGSYYSFGILGGFYLAGAAFDDARALSVAQDGIASSLIASGIINPVLKFSFGRSRPRQERGPHTFRPFSRNISFPSGHTTQAFAVGSVIAAHYDSVWIQSTVYGVAALVGFSRVELAAHFVSDVVAGALIGSAVGNAVVRFNTQHRNQIRISPVLNGDLRGLTLAFTY